MKNRKNYTQTELQLIETASQSRGTAKRIARRVAKELKRSEIGVYIQVMKYRKLQKAANGTIVAAPIVAQPAKQAIKTTKDFVLNFTPKKTEVFQDHVRLYF
jgi:menaquinone-dependent protoporphyrinogen IX oxidase